MEYRLETIESVRAKHLSGESFMRLDVREGKEWAVGLLPQVIHLGKDVLERDIETSLPNPDSEIILYCGVGYRSVLAADSLQKMGYTHVSSMMGGWRAWKEARYPSVKL